MSANISIKTDYQPQELQDNLLEEKCSALHGYP